MALVAISSTFVSGLAIPAESEVEARAPYPFGRTSNLFMLDYANGVPDAAEISTAFEPKKGKACKYDGERQ